MSDRIDLPVREGYDRWAEVYDIDGNPLTAMEEPVVRDWLGDVRGKVVADIGCGTGRHSQWLVAQGAKVVAFDVSEGMMRKARPKVAGDGNRTGPAGGMIQFVNHRLPDALPLRDRTVDIALCALVAEHLDNLPLAFAEMARVTKPGGTVVFTALHPAMNLRGITARFFDPQSGAEVRVQANEYTVSDYVNAAITAGLQIVELNECVVTSHHATATPRAEKYVGWPLFFGIRMTAP